jgi:hypothetical protein
VQQNEEKAAVIALAAEQAAAAQREAAAKERAARANVKVYLDIAKAEAGQRLHKVIDSIAQCTLRATSYAAALCACLRSSSGECVSAPLFLMTVKHSASSLTKC